MYKGGVIRRGVCTAYGWDSEVKAVLQVSDEGGVSGEEVQARELV
jgi:hypothetical protein